MANDRPWSTGTRSLDTPHVSDALAWIERLRETHLFIAERHQDFRLLTLGLAVAAGLPVHIVLLRPAARPREVAEALRAPLHRPGKVLLASETQADLVSEMLAAWDEFASDTRGSTTFVAPSGLVLSTDALEDTPCTLIGLSAAPPSERRGHQITRVPADEADTLEFIARQASRVRIVEIG